MKIGYIAVEKFDKSYGDSWTKYIEFSKLYHLEEVISLDGPLCSNIIKDYDDDCYNYMITDIDYCGVFKDLDWLVKKVRNITDIQILAVSHEPQFDCALESVDERFTFCGYDLVDNFPNGISALLNCGGFEKAFTNSDISKVGLITNYDNARKIQKLLVENYPEEDHALCDLWGIWKMHE